MPDLRARILDQLDRLEALARAADQRPWFAVTREAFEFLSIGDDGGLLVDPDGRTVADGADYRHIAAWQPAAALALCAGARQLVELHQPEHDDYVDGDGMSRGSIDCTTCDNGGTSYTWPCDTITAVARMFGIDPDAG